MAIFLTENGKPILTKGADTPLTINGAAVPILEKSAEKIIPIAYCEYYNGSETLTIPVYLPENVKYPLLRISTTAGIGCFDLIETNDSASSQIRINTRSGLYCVKKI